MYIRKHYLIILLHFSPSYHNWLIFHLTIIIFIYLAKSAKESKRKRSYSWNWRRN